MVSEVCMQNPHVVDVFTCAEILTALFGDLSKVSTEEATKSFEEWLIANNALFYSGNLAQEEAVCKAILCAIASGSKIVVMAGFSSDRDDEENRN